VIATPHYPEKRQRHVCDWLRLFERWFRADWLRCLTIALVGFFVHSPALQGQRIWDDQYLSRDNPFIKSPLLVLEAFRHYLFLDSFSSHYRPIQNISFIGDYFFWNTNEFGFHLTNVLLHIGSGILLFYLGRQLILSFRLRRLTGQDRQTALKETPWISNVAFAIALLWVAHPVHSAAVDYISGRADSLAFLFAAAAWLLFIGARHNERSLFRLTLYSLSALSALVALLSREIACVWIVLFLAHLFFIEKRVRPRVRVAALLCCLALVGTYAGMRHLPEGRPPQATEAGWTAPVRAILMLRALGDYGRLMVFPGNLHMERNVFDPTSCQSNAGWRKAIRAEYLSILGLILLAVLVLGCIKPGRGRAMRSFGAVWFLAAYLPVSNIVQLNATAAEHWLYLPSVGFLIFVGGWLIELPVRFRPLATALAILATAGLGARSFARSTDWINEETFYKRTFAAGGRSARVEINLGQIYAGRGDYAEAEKIFRAVLQLVPDYPIAQNNLASILARQGKSKEAEALFALIEKNSMKTRREYPRTWIGALNLAYVRHKAGNDESALAVLERAHSDYPEVWELIRLKAEIVREHRGPDAALRLVQDFARENWWHQGAAIALGQLYSQSGDIKRADSAFELATRLDVHGTEALKLLVELRVRENRFQEAYQLQRRAVARQPDQPSQYVLLSNVLEKMGRTEEAGAALTEASRLRALVQNTPARSL
jgi:protein O-mannosyl-transferase